MLPVKPVYSALHEVNARDMVRITAFMKWEGSMRFWTIAAAAAMLAMGTTAQADTGFLSIKGQKSGDIKGDVAQKGHEGWNSVVAIDYGLTIPTDAASGLPTGRRQHQPISFTLRWSKATPLLLSAAASNENLMDVQFQRWAPQLAAASGTGAEVNSDTIQLTNARIVSLKIIDRNGNDNPIDPVVVITLAYQKLTLTHVDGGITAEDSWGQ